MSEVKIIIPHEGVNEIPEGYKPLMTADGRLVSIVPENMHSNDALWIKSANYTSINWEQRRFELAKAAMNGLLGCCSYFKDDTNRMLYAERGNDSQLVKQSVDIADEMIKQLKETPTINSD